MLPTLIASRIAVSLCLGTHSSARDRGLKRLLLPALQAQARALQALRAMPATELAERLATLAESIS